MLEQSKSDYNKYRSVSRMRFEVIGDNLKNYAKYKKIF